MKKWPLLVIILVVLALTQMNILVHDREFWFDEAFSAETVNMLGEGYKLDWRQHDVHPPFYYSALNVWNKLNPGIYEHMWLREFSVIFLVLFLVVIYAALSKAFGWRGEVATILIAFLSTYIHYGTEARQYMMVLFFSAVIFYGVVTGFKHWFVALASFTCIILLPLTHYLSFMAIPFYMVMYTIYWKKKKGFVDKDHLLYIAMFAVIALVSALSFALPQAARVHGTWFQAPSISSFMSANVFAFYYIGALESPVAPIWIYLLFVVATVFFAWLAFKTIGKKMSAETSLLLMMGATALVPLAALLFLSLGEGGFFDLYHHRFFLVLTWMVPAAAFVTMLKVKRVIALLAIIVVMIVSGFMMYSYMDTQHYELKEMQESTPCMGLVDTGNGVYSPAKVWIGHESPFSALSYEVWARENGCWWHNFISTRVSQEMLNAGGADVLDKDQIYLNLTLPDEGFFYVQSIERTFNLTGRKYEQVDWAPGIRLLKVAPRASLTVEVRLE